MNKTANRTTDKPPPPTDQEADRAERASRAEQAVLGGMLLSDEAAKLAASELAPEDFEYEVHQRIVRALLRVLARGEPCDRLVVGMELFTSGLLEDCGGEEYLQALERACPNEANILAYVDRLKDGAAIRRVQDWADRGQEAARKLTNRPELAKFLEEYVPGAQALYDLVNPPGAGTSTLAALGETLRETSWLWPSWIPRGHLTVLGGETGVGKSITALYLSLAATGQLPWPDQGKPPAEGGRVLWCDTEGRQGVTYQRVAEWKFDPACVILPGADGLAEIDLGKPGTAAQIGKQAKDSGAGLVVIDSLSGGHKLDENSAVLRVFLKECQQAARDNALAILLLHHATKRGQLQGPEMTLDRLRGSSTISQFAVSVLALDRPDAGSKRVRLHALKMNLGQAPEPLGFAFDGDSSFPFWGQPPEKPVVVSVEEEAVQFIRDQLKAGPRLAREVWEASESVGLGKRAMEKAKRALGIEPYQQGGRGFWWWRLP